MPPTGAFNLEVWTGGAPYPTVPAAGYQGLAILGPGGTSITLDSGVFAVADLATGGQQDTITALGDDETISASPGNNDAYGAGDAITGGGADTINVYGNNATVNGADNAWVYAGTGNDTIFIYSGSNGDTINAGTGNNATVNGVGNATINVLGSSDSVFGGSGDNNLGNDFARYDTVAGGIANETLIVLGADNNLIVGEAGTDTIIAVGSNNSIFTDTGNDTINSYGIGNTVTAGIVVGTNAALINADHGSMTFVDGTNFYSDTVVGFSTAAGDTINLSTNHHTVSSSSLVNGDQDTQITLGDGSTILLRGITRIDGSFFS